MKKIFIVPFCAVMLLSGYVYDADQVGNKGRDDYWTCSVIGHMEDGGDKVLPLSGVFPSPNSDYEKMEVAFEETANDQMGGGFVADLPPKCMDFETGEKAEKNRATQRRLAQENGYRVVDIEFGY